LGEGGGGLLFASEETQKRGGGKKKGGTGEGVEFKKKSQKSKSSQRHCRKLVGARGGVEGKLFAG